MLDPKTVMRMTNDEIMDGLAHLMFMLRMDKKMDQSQVADRSGLSQSTISRIEAGRCRDITTLFRYFEAVNSYDNSGHTKS